MAQGFGYALRHVPVCLGVAQEDLSTSLLSVVGAIHYSLGFLRKRTDRASPAPSFSDRVETPVRPSLGVRVGQ
jgi:hypothetical protein